MMRYGLPEKQGLYDPELEHDACGIGFVADLKSAASHTIVEQATEILCRLTHRGAAGSDEATRLTPPRRLTLEQAIAYIEDDERVEVTPGHVRLRKQHLVPHERKRAQRRAEDG